MLRLQLLVIALLLVNATTEQSSAGTVNSNAVGSQYDSSHAYVASADFDRFVSSLIATLGGTAGKRSEVTVTPTTSRTLSQLVMTPSGTVSAFAYTTPVPWPFGSERTGYLVSDLDVAVAEAAKAGAEVLVAPFSDPIGRDAIVQWPGGVMMQLYWHTVPPSYPPLARVPENRVYVASGSVHSLIRCWLAFSHGRVVSDDPSAAGIEIGRPGEHYRRIRLISGYGNMTVLATDGHLPWPYGRETTGYGVADLDATLLKATAAGVEVLVPVYESDHRRATILRFPGGYIAELHGEGAS